MKILDITPITDASEFPVKKGTLQFLQDAYKESLGSTIQALIGSAYLPNTVYILYGVINSGSGAFYSITSGAAFYNGEVFAVDATGFTATGSNVGLFKIAVSQYMTDADPVTFTDTTIRNVHNIRKLSVQQGASGSAIADYSQAVFLNFNIPPPVTVSASTIAGNIAQVLGGFPNYQVYTPAPSGWRFLYVGNFIIGAVGVTGTVLEGNGCSSYNVTFPDVGRSDYFIGQAVMYRSGNAESQAAIGLAFTNKTNTGFTLVVKKKDPSSGTTDLTLDYQLIVPI
jgi:hypothetical protein